jgi:Lrp/AsnC family transcriptional regulator, leucine-responsive regulatory protein
VFEDGRASVETVAQKVGLSPTPVRLRIQRLREEGVIRGYRADVDLAKCGLELAVIVFVKLSNRDRASIAAFEKRVQSIGEITRCSLISGPFDYMLTIHASGMAAYNQTLRTQLAELPGVFGIETSFVISEVKTFTKLPL